MLVCIFFAWQKSRLLCWCFEAYILLTFSSTVCIETDEKQRLCRCRKKIQKSPKTRNFSFRVFLQGNFFHACHFRVHCEFHASVTCFYLEYAQVEDSVHGRNLAEYFGVPIDRAPISFLGYPEELIRVLSVETRRSHTEWPTALVHQSYFILQKSDGHYLQ